MDGLALVTAATTSSSIVGVAGVRPPSCISPLIRTKRISLRRNSCKFVVLASKDDSKLDPWIQMELKFGQMLGEDPKLTMAKIMARKSDPDASYLAVEKEFYDKKGKYEEVEEVPFDLGIDSNTDKKLSTSLGGLNLIRPVPKKGVKFENETKPAISELKKPNQSIKKPIDNKRSSVPNVILRKPTTYAEEDDIGASKIRMKPNLSFGTGNDQKRETFSDITLLKKPAPFISKENLDDEQDPIVERRTRIEGDGIEVSRSIDATILRHPERMDVSLTSDDSKLTKDNSESTKEPKGNDDTIERLNASSSAVPPLEIEPAAGLQPIESSEEEATEKESVADSESRFSMEAALLQGKPTRMDQSLKEPPTLTTEVTGIQSAGLIYDGPFEFQSFGETSPIKEHEDIYWSKVEELNRTGGREEVDLISASSRGFVVSFGSLIGFLPYRNLVARWKFIAFESWLRKKGLDPSKYRQNLGIVGKSNSDNISALDTASATNIDQKFEEEILPDMKLDDLSRIYDQEKLSFLSSFVGQKIKVNVVLADRKTRKLVFSIKPKEKEEMLTKKRSLMAQLSIGDVVKCCIKKITYFGIFVEIDGVLALIHQTEVSWDATLDPASYFKVGQTVEAKVHQLDFSLGRIFLSLKEITPDPLIEALEAVIGDPTSLDGGLEAAQKDTEWADVEILIQELEKYEGIQSVSKGRFFLSPGLAPTFQVYMASMFENEYKLLARAENRVQEVIVETSLGKEELKNAITTCTNRVE
ncbi:uncharacterized protein LOC124944694 [Impatiens glandulifera]|uniref:uncharacterized protein LOC124944694 n=1 Tax=Impatiens glandulifera TaxID=253017 RepID=UPI001FB0E659|nr:uncharacterized protein LOC124944694 [Impatiens glandulifera]